MRRRRFGTSAAYSGSISVAPTRTVPTACWTSPGSATPSNTNVAPSARSSIPWRCREPFTPAWFATGSPVSCAPGVPGRGLQERDGSGHEHVTREATYGDRRGCLQSLVAAQLAGFELLADGELDLALGGDAQLLEEPAHRHVEGVVVHKPSRRPLC